MHNHIKNHGGLGEKVSGAGGGDFYRDNREIW